MRYEVSGSCCCQLCALSQGAMGGAVAAALPGRLCFTCVTQAAMACAVSFHKSAASGCRRTPLLWPDEARRSTVLLTNSCALHALLQVRPGVRLSRLHLHLGPLLLRAPLC